jgi:hypothetical protein
MVYILLFTFVQFSSVSATCSVIFKNGPCSYRRLAPILSHCVNSVSSLALDFGYRLALDFGLDHIYATCKLTVTMCFAVQNQQLIAAVQCTPFYCLLLYILSATSSGIF